jgi:glycolate oxidase
MRLRGRRDTPAATTDPLVSALRAALSPSRVLDGPFEKALYAKDASALDPQEPGVVCLVETTAEVQACVRIARAFGRPITPRGSGTGLAGGAVPLDEPVVIVTTKMQKLREVNEEGRFAWVEPGLRNLDLSKQIAHRGLYYAPDPSSQQSSSIGGNVATNAGGPHCLLHGVTSAHVLAMEVVLPDASVVMLGGLDPDPVGYDLRGAFVGSEGTMGIVTAIAVRLLPIAPEVRTLLASFVTIRQASAAVSAIISAGILPSALEMMDRNCVHAVENFAKAGLPLDAGAVLLVEVEGLAGGVEESADRIAKVCTAGGATNVRTAATASERAALWKARKSAFGAIANIKPNYYLHDCVVPRTKLADIMDEVTRIADEQQIIVLNVFHAGDGNLHPLLVFDKREPGVMERVHAAGDAIIRVCIEAGGMLSGEHGIGLEKRDYMPLVFTDIDLAQQMLLRNTFDPDTCMNPAKVLPEGSRCGELRGGGPPGGSHGGLRESAAHAHAEGVWV